MRSQNTILVRIAKVGGKDPVFEMDDDDIPF